MKDLFQTNSEFRNEFIRIGDDFSMGFTTPTQYLFQLEELCDKVGVRFMDAMPDVDNLLRDAILKIYTNLE